MVRSCAVLAVLLTILVSPLAAASDVTGTWSGSYVLPGISGEFRMTVGQIGTSLVARMQSRGFSQAPISGTIAGDELRCGLRLASGESVELLGHVDGDRLVASLRTADGRAGSATLVREPLVSAAATDVTGTWSGTMTATEHPCDDPTVVKSWSSSTTLAVLQQQGVASGTFTIDALPDFSGPACSVAGTNSVNAPFSGQVSGSTISGSFVVRGDHGNLHSISFNGTVNGNMMTVSISETDFSASVTLTQTSTQSPFGGLTGSYSGTINGTIIPCERLAPVPFAGTATGSILQVGSTLTGSVVVTGTKSDHDDNGVCTLSDDPPGTAFFTGSISGNTITANVTSPDGKLQAFTGTISGNTITLNEAQKSPGEFLTITLTRTSSGMTPGIPAPSILAFSANPSTISSGGSTTLTWTSLNAGSATIDNGVGSQTASGSVTVSPSQTTTYTLTVSGPGGTATASTTVTVSSGSPSLVIGTLPSGMLQATGSSGATDSFSVSNVGSGTANVTLTQNGNFFSVSPSSFTLAPGSSQIVGITATSQSAGAYDGSVTISPGGATVPVHLLVASPPTAPVIPQTVPRTDVSLPAGQNPTGSISVTNNGTGTLQGIAVSDVPWIIPQSGVITIAPGQTAQITFSIDRSKRPDTAALLGGLAGKISLIYLKSAAGKTTALGTAPTGSVSVTIVDVVKPNVAAGSPPPLNAGELAYFIDGLRTNNRFNGDLMLSSFKDVPDLKMILTAQSQQQIGTLPSVPSNTGVAFPAVIKNVFGVTGLGGSLQVRSSSNPSVALTAVESTNVTDPTISSVTALPILRSDRGIGVGERLVFTGADNSTADGTSASVFVQEVSGNAGHVSLEYRDQNGNVAGTDSSALTPFGFFTNTVPAATRSIIVTNDSTGSARLSGYASVQADGSGDSWILLDPKQFGSASGSLIVPMVAAGSQTDLYVANSSSSPVSATLGVGSGNRRRSVRLAGGGASMPQSVTIGAMSASRISVTPFNGYVRIDSNSGSVSAVGRVTRSVSGTIIGSSLPAFPASSAIAGGLGKLFAGVDDSSAKTVAAATPGTYRSTLMLIETTGQTTTVGVALRYTFVAGATVSSQGNSTRQFTLGPNQVLTIADLARSIIGPQRDAFGDLRNMQVEVDVFTGGGKVLAFIETIDNASGDIAVRAE